MAEGKYSTITTAVAAAGSFAVGIVGTYFSMSDTSPRSLEEIATALTKIAAAVESVDTLDEESVAAANAILLSTGEIGGAIVEKGSDVELTEYAGVVLNEERIPLALGNSVAIELQGGERVSMTFEAIHSNGSVYIYVNNRKLLRGAGQRPFTSRETGCFLELFEIDEAQQTLSLIAVCPNA